MKKSPYRELNWTFITLTGLMLLLTAFTTRHYTFMPGLAGIAGMAVLMFSRDRRPVLPLRTGIILAGITVLGFVSALWAINPDETIERAVKVSGVFLGGWLFVTACMNYPPDLIRAPARYVPFVILFVSMVLLIDMTAGFPFFRLVHGLGPDIYVNDYELNKETSALVFLLPAMLAPLIYQRHKIAASVFFILPVAVLLLLTPSQAAQLAAVTGVSAFVLFPFFPGGRKISWYIAGGILITGLWTSPLLAPLLFEHTAEFFNSHPLLIESSASQRLEIWNFLGGKIQSDPFLGQGMYATRFIEDFETEQLYYKSATVMHPHNAALQLWLEFGVPGALAGTAAITALLRMCYEVHDQRLRRLYFTAFCMIFAVALIGWGLWQGWWPGTMFAVAGITILAGRLAYKKGEAQ